MPHRTLVYATVLYWQSAELPLLQNCVASLLAQGLDEGTELRILLVDNGSGLEPPVLSDGRLELLRLAQNRGFSGGHNAAMRRALAAGADYVLLFNSDAVAEPGLIRALIDAGEANPKAALIGPLLVRAAQPARVESAGQSFSLITARHREIARGRLACEIHEHTHAVPALSGCALLARRSAIQRIGLLDERLFAYFEDMDWCLRARRGGYDVVLVPRARVRHIGGASTAGQAALSTYYSVRNHLLVARSACRCNPLAQVLVIGYHLAFICRSRRESRLSHVAALTRGAWAAWTRRVEA